MSVFVSPPMTISKKSQSSDFSSAAAESSRCNLRGTLLFVDDSQIGINEKPLFAVLFVKSNRSKFAK